MIPKKRKVDGEDEGEDEDNGDGDGDDDDDAESAFEVSLLDHHGDRVMAPMAMEEETGSPPPPLKKIKLKIKFGGTEIGSHEVNLEPHRSESGSPAPTATTTMNVSDMIRVEDLDISNVPRSINDIVEVRQSTIPNAGMGLYAKRDLPPHIPLGFYFGVPMTEDEFDSLKDHLGMASHYSIMYRKTVLDATDDRGMPYNDPNGPIWCPFHFMNEKPEPMRNVEFLNGAVVNQVIVFTTREIKEGEELFVFYGKEVDREGWGTPK
jgi:hypothetical protein